MGMADTCRHAGGCFMRHLSAVIVNDSLIPSCSNQTSLSWHEITKKRCFSAFSLAFLACILTLLKDPRAHLGMQ